MRSITPGLLLGTALGALIVGLVPTRYLTLFFALFVYLVATQMVLGLKPTSTRATLSRTELTLAGAFIGCLSSLVSIGGGVLSTPYLLWHKLNLRHAIATSAALGFPIAVGGTLGYIVNGYRVDALPEYSLGYVYLPALLGVAVTSVLFSQLGARWAHRIPAATLKKIFAALLAIVGAKLLYG